MNNNKKKRKMWRTDFRGEIGSEKKKRMKMLLVHRYDSISNIYCEKK
jgi:hypothetical protein